MSPFKRFRFAPAIHAPVRTLIPALALFLALLPLGAAAVEGGNQASASAKSGEALIITSAEQPARCIAPVHINRIDGREVKVQKLGFDVEAGQHTMSGRAVIDTSFCPAVGVARGGEVQPLEAEFEAGKTYYVGLDHSAPHRSEWKLVIWKVEGPDRS